MCKFACLAYVAHTLFVGDAAASSAFADIE